MKREAKTGKGTEAPQKENEYENRRAVRNKFLNCLIVVNICV